MDASTNVSRDGDWRLLSSLNVSGEPADDAVARVAALGRGLGLSPSTLAQLHLALSQAIHNALLRSRLRSSLIVRVLVRRDEGKSAWGFFLVHKRNAGSSAGQEVIELYLYQE
ncbi:MAG: hypothetical protein ACOCXI_13970 [Chloroflexota bacterium]